MPGFVRKIIALLMASLLASWWYSRPTAAHGGPVPLTFWGNYGTAVAGCQRAIGQAAGVCGLRAVQLRSDCRLEDFLGQGCNTVATEAAIQAVRGRARTAVRLACDDPAVQTLGYIDRSEAITDVINICRDLDTAAVSASFGALDTGGAGGTGTGAECVRATAEATSRLLATAVASWRTALDRIAAINMSVAGKRDRVARFRQRIATATEAAAEAVSRSCVDAEFEAVYGRDLELHLANVARLADCFGGAVYVQDAVVCPQSECGNGIREKGEDCDDGNRDAGDACSATCGNEASAA